MIEIIGGQEHGILDGLNVESVSLEKPKPCLFPQHYLVTSEKGISEGISCIGKVIKSWPVKRVYDVELINGLVIKCCFLVVHPGKFNIFPQVGDACIVLFTKPQRANRANFKPHMRRRLKAVRR